MRTSDQSAKRARVVLLLVAGGSVLLGAFQQRRLVILRDAIASEERERGTLAESRAEEEAPRDPGDLLAEARGLLDVLVTPNSPETASKMMRLMALLEVMDAVAVRSLLDEAGDAAEGIKLKEALRWRFTQANPREAFRLAEDDPPDAQSKIALVGNFVAWANLDPAGVLKWYCEAEEEGLPLAKDKDLRAAVFAAQARLDPKRAIEGFRDHFEKDGGQEAKGEIPRLVSGLRNQSERMSFMLALNRNTEGNSGDGSFRDAMVSGLSKVLVKEPFDEASSLIDGTFTGEEREKFAKELTQGGFLNSDTWPQWAPWIVALDLPAERGQPIATMAAIVARQKSRFKDTRWLADLPAGPQRDLAVESYAMVSVESDFDEAIRWMGYLPAGERRKGVASNVAFYLERKDPAAAEALRSQEGVK